MVVTGIYEKDEGAMGVSGKGLHLIDLRYPDVWQYTNVVLNVWAFIFSYLGEIQFVCIVILYSAL